MISGNDLFNKNNFYTLEKPRRRSFTLNTDRIAPDNLQISNQPRSKNMGNIRIDHERCRSPCQKRRFHDNYRRSKSLHNREDLITPKIILSNESNRQLDLKKYKAEIEEDIRISTIKLRTLSLSRLRNSNPELYEEFSDNCLCPTLYRSIRHASCGDISAQFNYDDGIANKNLTIMHDNQMTSSNMNLNETNVRNISTRKKSKPQILNIELRKRAIEARVKQRKRGETLKSLDDDFLKAKAIMEKYKSKENISIKKIDEHKNKDENNNREK